MVIDWQNDTRILELARQLKNGGVIAYPTEAVWGLGCDPGNRLAVERLLQLKQRQVDKGLILIAGSLSQISLYTDGLSDSQRETLANSWPGPNTWLLPAEHIAPDWIRGKHASVAVRVSDHPVVQALCHAFGGPLVSTSANPQGKPSALTTSELAQYFGDSLDGIAPGELGGLSSPSTIRDLLSGATIR